MQRNNYSKIPITEFFHQNYIDTLTRFANSHFTMQGCKEPLKTSLDKVRIYSFHMVMSPNHIFNELKV